MMVTPDPATERVINELAKAPTLGAVLAVGRVAEVFACGELVVKLYKPTVPNRSPFGEAAILTAVEALGLPVPIVYGVHRIGERWGVLMSRVDGPALAE
jgi:hypothetical protein